MSDPKHSVDIKHLVQMANDIGNFFRAQPNREDAIAGIENHIKSFWTPRMRAKLLTGLTLGNDSLDELPREALLRLKTDPGFTPHQGCGGDAG